MLETWFCLGVAYLSFVACSGQCAHWCWSWPPGWTQTCQTDTVLSSSHWAVPDSGCCFRPALLSLLLYCGLVPLPARTLPVPALSCPASGFLAPQSCCSLTVKTFLNSLWLWQLLGIWQLINIYVSVFLRYRKWFRDALHYIFQEWVL